jgi:hypothetical protein
MEQFCRSNANESFYSPVVNWISYRLEGSKNHFKFYKVGGRLSFWFCMVVKKDIKVNDRFWFMIFWWPLSWLTSNVSVFLCYHIRYIQFVRNWMKRNIKRIQCGYSKSFCGLRLKNWKCFNNYNVKSAVLLVLSHVCLPTKDTVNSMFDYIKLKLELSIVTSRCSCGVRNKIKE